MGLCQFRWYWLIYFIVTKVLITRSDWTDLKQWSGMMSVSRRVYSMRGNVFSPPNWLTLCYFQSIDPNALHNHPHFLRSMRLINFKNRCFKPSNQTLTPTYNPPKKWAQPSMKMCSFHFEVSLLASSAITIQEVIQVHIAKGPGVKPFDDILPPWWVVVVAVIVFRLRRPGCIYYRVMCAI